MAKHLMYIILFGFLLSSCKGDIVEPEPDVITCRTPINLRTSPIDERIALYWDHAGAETYTVVHGYEGFTLGSDSGLTFITSDQFFKQIPMEAEQAYDFYVIAYCNSARGESLWAGPLTYLNSFDQYLCNPPSNIEELILVNNLGGGPFGVEMSWDPNGEESFQIIMGAVGLDPNETPSITAIEPSHQFTDIEQNTDYHFYVRGKCIMGQFTEWVGPVLVNIGG